MLNKCVTFYVIGIFFISGCGADTRCTELKSALATLREAETVRQERSSVEKVRVLLGEKHSKCAYRVFLADAAGNKITSEEFYARYNTEKEMKPSVIIELGQATGSERYFHTFVDREAFDYLTRPN
jgi:hypothetical protein